jgi:proteasome lid subunit RPN8/RPN11
MQQDVSELPLSVGITPSAQRKLHGYIRRCPEEISGLGTVAVIDGRLVITDVFLLDQEVTPSETVLSALTIAEFLCTALERGINPAEVRLWWHSHARHDTYFSGTDQQTIEDTFDLSPWWLSVVGNHAGSYRARLDLYPTKEMPLRLTKPVALSVVPDTEFDAEIDAAIGRHVQFPKPLVKAVAKGKPTRTRRET